MAITTFSEVQSFFNDFLEANGITSLGRHGRFWEQVPGDVDASRDKFVNGTVPNIPGDIRIMIPGDSDNSMVVKSLRGDPPFNTGLRMPLGGPFYSDAQVQELADWIDGLGTPDNGDTGTASAVPEAFRMAPAPMNCRLVAFDEISINAGIIPDTWFLTVNGSVPCANMRVQLIPYVYVRQPEYWQIEVTGCLEGGICLPVVKPYSVTIPLANIRGTKGIEVIGSNNTVRRDVPPAT